jgi:uncharacterized repeat protein (TIGR03803 family)
MLKDKLSQTLLAAFLTIMAASMVSLRPGDAATEYLFYTFCTKPACADGAAPHTGIHRIENTFYATTTIGNKNNTGSVLAFENGHTRVINDTAEPGDPPIELNNVLYGTTTSGGSAGAGTLYTFGAHQLTVLYSFCAEQNCKDGAFPQAKLIAWNGLLYGTTVFGGAGNCGGPFPGCGTVFSFDPATGTEKVVYSFCSLASCADGSKPQANVNEVAGILYGTTSTGGQTGKDCNDVTPGCGTVFGLDPNTGAETVLHAFAGGHDGGEPAAPVLNVHGILYGTTQGGGHDSSCWFEGVSGYVKGCGTVFSIDPTSGAETVVHTFVADGNDGQNPVAGLIRVKDLLYGTTVNGGSGGPTRPLAAGTVFSLNLKNGAENIVYSFCSQSNCTDGYRPYGKLITVQGKLFGTTSGGGDGFNHHHQILGAGAIFVVVP